MNNDRTCGGCNHFVRTEGMHICICANPATETLYVQPTTDRCKHFEPRTTKIKPRRLCDFCERRRPIEDDYGRYSMELTSLIPLPSINLTTGEKTEPERKVEYALFLYEDKDGGEVGSFPIKYCPLCGRKLYGEGEK